MAVDDDNHVDDDHMDDNDDHDHDHVDDVDARCAVLSTRPTLLTTWSAQVLLKQN